MTQFPGTPHAYPERLTPPEGTTGIPLDADAVTAFYESLNVQAGNITGDPTRVLLNPETATYDEVLGVVDVYAAMPLHADQRDSATAVANAVGGLLDYLAVSPKEKQIGGAIRSGSKEVVSDADRRERRARNAARARMITAIAKRLVYLDTLGPEVPTSLQADLVEQFVRRLEANGLDDAADFTPGSVDDLNALLSLYDLYLRVQGREEDLVRPGMVRDHLLGRQVDKIDKTNPRATSRILNTWAPGDIARMLQLLRPALAHGEVIETPEQMRATLFVRPMTRRILADSELDLDEIGTDVLTRFVDGLADAYPQTRRIVFGEGNYARIADSTQWQQELIQEQARGGTGDVVLRRIPRGIEASNLLQRFVDFHKDHMGVEVLQEVLEQSRVAPDDTLALLSRHQLAWLSGDADIDTIESYGLIARTYLKNIFRTLRAPDFDAETLSAVQLKRYEVLADRLTVAAEHLGVEWQTDETPWEYLHRLAALEASGQIDSQLLDTGKRLVRGQPLPRPRAPRQPRAPGTHITRSRPAPARGAGERTLPPATPDLPDLPSLIELPGMPDRSDAVARGHWNVLFSYRAGSMQGGDDPIRNGVDRVARAGHGVTEVTDAAGLVRQALDYFGLQ